MTMPSDGAVFADEADLPVCAEQPVVDKPTAAKSDKSIFFIRKLLSSYITVEHMFYTKFIFM